MKNPDNINLMKTLLYFMGEELEPTPQEKDWLLNTFVIHEGIKSLMEDTEGLRLLSMGYRRLHDQRYPMRPKVLFGKFYLTPKGRLFHRIKDIPDQVLQGMPAVMNFDSFQSIIEEKGIDVSLPENRYFPKYNNTHEVSSDKERCAWCHKPWDEDDRSLHFDDHYRLYSVDAFLRRSPFMPTLKDLRRKVARVVRECLPQGAMFIIYPFAHSNPKNLYDYLRNSSLVSQDQVLHKNDNFLLKVTLPMHSRCLAQAFEKQSEQLVQPVWDELESLIGSVEFSLCKNQYN